MVVLKKYGSHISKYWIIYWNILEVLPPHTSQTVVLKLMSALKAILSHFEAILSSFEAICSHFEPFCGDFRVVWALKFGLGSKYGKNMGWAL